VEGWCASGGEDSLPAKVAGRAEKITVETISNYQAFLDLEPVWRDVAEAAGCDHPFLEHAWVRTWWESFGAGSTLHILVLRAGKRPIAIAPLMLTPVRMYGVKVLRLGFLYNAHVPCADFLISDRPDEVYRAIWTHLSHNRRWDVLQLCQLADGGETLKEVPRLAAASGCRIGVWASDASPYVLLSSSWDAYFNSLAAKHRSNLRNRLKRLKAAGPVELATIASADGLAEALETGFRLEAAAWKGEAETAISCDPAVSRFYSTLADRAAEQGWILITHDRGTMVHYYRERLQAGQPCSGILVIPQRALLGEIIESLLLVWTESQSEEWRNQIVFLPFR